jgi:tRNA threonylcarbamoyladenosine biosynthesis protein TsaE
METITESAQETQALGEKIATKLVASRKKQVARKGVVLALTGELGSGKTTFSQGLAKGLGIKKRVISPTFIVIRKYDIRYTIYERRVEREVLRFSSFYHVDLYRFEKDVESEVKNLGIEEIWDNPENIVAIEWAEKIQRLVPKDATWVTFENLGGDERKIIFRNKS